MSTFESAKNYRTYKRNRARRNQRKKYSDLQVLLGTGLINQPKQPPQNKGDQIITGYPGTQPSQPSSVHKKTLLEGANAITRQLQDELRGARKEIKRLQEENERLRREDAAETAKQLEQSKRAIWEEVLSGAGQVQANAEKWLNKESRAKTSEELYTKFKQRIQLCKGESQGKSELERQAGSVK